MGYTIQMRKDKKAQVTDVIFVLATLVSIAIVMVVGGFIYMKVGTGLQESGIQGNSSEQAYKDMGVAFPIFDNSFLFVIIGLISALVVSSFFIPSHPIFLWINIGGFLVLIFIGAVLANSYGSVIEQAGLNDSAQTYFGSTTFAISKLPWIGAITILITSIVMYAKGREEGTYG